MESVEKAIQAVKEQLPGMKLLENEPMSRHSSFRIGGPARVLAFPSDVTGLSKLCDILKEHETAPFLLETAPTFSSRMRACRTCFSSAPKACRSSSCCRTAPSMRKPGSRWHAWRPSRRKTDSAVWSLPAASPGPWGAAAS